MLFVSVLIFTMMVGSVSAFYIAPTHNRAVSKLNMGFFKKMKQNLVKSIAGNYDEAAVSAQLDKYIATSKGGKVTMLTFETCPFCVKARDIMDVKGIKYDDVQIDKLDEGKFLRVELGKKFGQTSVPAIWVDEKFIGGCNNGGMGGLVPLMNSGKFDELLSAK